MNGVQNDCLQRVLTTGVMVVRKQAHKNYTCLKMKLQRKVETHRILSKVCIEQKRSHGQRNSPLFSTVRRALCSSSNVCLHDKKKKMWFNFKWFSCKKGEREKKSGKIKRQINT